MARRSKAEALVTRERILEAAGKVFVERGVANSSLQKVAAEAGFTRGAIYWHFKDKSDLLAAVLARADQSWNMKEGHEVPALADNPLKTVEDLAVGALSRLQTSARLQQMFKLVRQLKDDGCILGSAGFEITGGSAEFVGQIRQQFELATKQGLVPRDLAADVAALGVFVLVEGLMDRWVPMPSSFDLLATGRSTVSAYIRGMHSPNCVV